MKRIGNLYQNAFTPEALLAAFHRAAKGKRTSRACFEFERHLASNIDQLAAELHDGTYRPRPYYSFMVYEPKARRIYAPAFRDLVVQHAIYALTYPIFNPTFIGQSFACRLGKGTHKAADYAQTALQATAPGSYTLKLDVRKFFYRIDRPILRRLIERKIKDRRFVDLMMLFADHGEPIGIPIGNLLSQLYALIYLNPVDHYIKRDLRVAHYGRYVDDMVLFGLSIDQAKALARDIEAFLVGSLNLELSRCSIARRQRGVNFVGYRTWASRRFIRKHSLYTFRRRARAGRLESCVSILGHARRTASYPHLIRHLKEHHHGLYRRLPKNHHRRPQRHHLAAHAA